MSRASLAGCASLPGGGGGPSIGVGARPPAGAEMLFDGTREMLDEKWTYWQGPRFSSSLPIKWRIVEDPVDGGTALMTDDPAAAFDGALARLQQMTPPGMKAVIHLSLTDDHPYAQAFVIIEALPE